MSPDSDEWSPMACMTPCGYCGHENALTREELTFAHWMRCTACGRPIDQAEADEIRDREEERREDHA